MKIAAIVGTLTILLCLFTAGLWPFNFYPKNQVELISGQGIHFQAWGQAISKTFLSSLETGQPVTIAIDVLPEQAGFRRVSRILSLIDETGHETAFIGQWGPHLIVRNADQPSRNRPHSEISAINAFNMGSEAKVAITSGSDGTYIYINGKLVERSRSVRLVPVDGRSLKLLIGNSPSGSDPWRGTLRSLLIQKVFLDTPPSEAVFVPTSTGTGPSSGIILDYAFSDDRYRRKDLSGYGNDLEVPARFFPVKGRFFEFSPEEFRINRSRVSDISLNLIGFVPLGLFMSVTLLLVRSHNSKWNLIMVFLVGSTVSLIIESGQIFLPSRTSSMSDLLLNSIGTVVGIMLFEASALSFRAGMRYQKHLPKNSDNPEEHMP